MGVPLKDMKSPKGDNIRPGPAFWLVLIVIDGTTIWQKASAPPEPVTDEPSVGLFTQEMEDQLSRYLISNGPVLADGDSVGISETERIRVKYAVVHSTQTPVYRLTLQATDGA